MTSVPMDKPKTTRDRTWFKVQDDVLTRIRETLPPERVKELQRIRPWRHFLTVARQVAQMLLCGYVCWTYTNPLIWVPAAALQGVTVLGFIILLHEQLHNVIFSKDRPHPELNKVLGHLYAWPSAISSTQFTKWHLDHHGNLGHEVDDPKRGNLSPKINKRWYKILYFTAALVGIYARAAKAENVRYPDDLRAKIRKERMINFGLHILLAVVVGVIGGWYTLARVHLVPMLVFFPIAFIVNRLGQHYWIDETDPAKWGTRVDGNPVIHYLFLWSNFHLEHHYYPQVPMYNLTRLNRELRPFFEKIGWPNRTYRELFKGWVIENRVSHTNWEASVSTDAP